jgi:phage baseplate assembly protein W
MAREFLGIGWKFPVQVDSTGEIAMSEYEQDIREAIRIILSTSKGERMMRPDFGCGIHDHVFAVVNNTTIGLIESSVREALSRWEPRIDLLNVQVSTEDAEEAKLNTRLPNREAGVDRLFVGIDYRVRATNNEFNVVYPFYLTES